MSITAQSLSVYLSDALKIPRSEVRRLIDTGNVSLNDRTLTPGEHDVQATPGCVVKVDRIQLPTRCATEAEMDAMDHNRDRPAER